MVDGDDVAAEAAAANDPGFPALLEKLSDTYKFDFREYKPASLVRRLRMRMNQVHVDSFEAYAQYMNAHPEEHVTLFNAILINVTGFLRDAEAWTALAEEVIPRILADAADTRSVRVWSAGCASGEETYSLAILLAEHLGNRASEFQVKIYGTDVDDDALAAARHALYRTEQIKDVPDHLLARYFLRDGQLWRLRRDLRRWCIFGAHNLAQSPPLSHVDLLVCRNVLIYFTGSLQDRIISRFQYSVRDGGFMFLGRSESLLARSKLFTPVNLKWRIFQRVPSSIRGELPLTRPDSSTHFAEPYERAEPGRVRVQRTLEALPSPVIVVDPVDTVLTWNPAAEALFEIPSVHAMGRNFRDLDVSYRVEGLRARLEDVKVRQATARMDGITLTRRGGELVHANIVIAPLFDASHFLGALISVDNATEHSRLKEQMMRIAEQHATAIEELQSTNEELETTNEELQSTNEQLETTNEELQSTNEELETTVEELQAANAELAALNAELEERGVELARLDTYHRGVVNSVEQGMVVMDKLGVVRTWNHAAERMWGLRSEQVVGRDFFSLPLAALVQRARPAFQRMLATGETQQLERVPYTIPGGAERLGRLRLVPITDGGGEISGGVASAWPQDDR